MCCGGAAAPTGGVQGDGSQQGWALQTWRPPECSQCPSPGATTKVLDAFMARTGTKRHRLACFREGLLCSEELSL